MQALILAAGMGSRLGGDTLKPLLEVGGKPILLRLLDQLEENGIHDAIITVGFQNERIKCALAGRNVKMIVNPFYRSSDNLVSFWIGQGELHEDFILSHADLVFEANLLAKLIHSNGDIVLPMDRASLNEESMKIQLDDNRISGIGKEIALNLASGESLPLMKFSRRALGHLKRITSDFVRSAQLRLYLESAIRELTRSEDLITVVLDVTGYAWMEVDTWQDLKAARTLFSADSGNG
ncbi:MAG: phosphocholine cytidylyltransferase family protein [bacterium]